MRLTGLTVQRFTEEDEETERGVLELTESGNFPTRGKESDSRGRWDVMRGGFRRWKTSSSRFVLLCAASGHYSCL